MKKNKLFFWRKGTDTYHLYVDIKDSVRSMGKKFPALLSSIALIPIAYGLKNYLQSSNSKSRKNERSSITSNMKKGMKLRANRGSTSKARSLRSRVSKNTIDRSNKAANRSETNMKKAA